MKFPPKKYGKGKKFSEFEASGQSFHFELIHEADEIFACLEEVDMLANMMEFLGYEDAQGEEKKATWKDAYKARLPNYVADGRAYLSIKNSANETVALLAVDINDTEEGKITATLNSFVVKESMQRKGFGPLLMCQTALLLAENDSEKNRTIILHIPLSQYSVEKGNIQIYERICDKLRFTKKEGMVESKPINSPTRSTIYKEDRACKVHVVDIDCGLAQDITKPTSIIRDGYFLALENIMQKLPRISASPKQVSKLQADDKRLKKAAAADV
jgi:hypothetical protein